MATIAPIHPGEVLLEDFLTPLEVPSTTWRSQSACRRGGSTRSSTASDALPPTPRCAWPAASAPPTGFGSTCRPAYDLEIEKDHLGTSLEEIRPLQSA
jgi:hypothetical protein